MPELMKGHVWHKRKHLVKYPVFVEVKHDEIRCHVIVQDGCVQFLSYAGNPLANMDQFAAQFAALASETGYDEFDCGFEANGNFKDSSRWIRSTTGLPADLLDVKTKFYLFDLPNCPDVYASRRPQVISVARAGGLEFVYGELALSEADVDSTYLAYRAAGYEGAMIKSFNHLYLRGKRGDWWLKMKPEEDASAVITGINQAFASTDNLENGIMAGDPLGRAGSISGVLADGSVVRAHGITHALAEDMWNNPQNYVGETFDFKFMEREETGGYRHPTFHRIREATA